MTETPPQGSASPASRLVTRLRELVSALDRRVPRAERPGEVGIARDARTLRSEALAQLEALEHHEPDDTSCAEELAEAVMTDDGSATAPNGPSST